MIYCDTSLLVAGLTVEQDSLRVQSWLTSQPEGRLCISHWVISEFSSALSIKLRRGDMQVSQRERIAGNWRVLQRDYLTILPVTPQAFDLAAKFCDRHETGLRSGDALHLAIASLEGHTLATLDKAFAAAAVEVGVALESV